jgi:hypothetical protein
MDKLKFVNEMDIARDSWDTDTVMRFACETNLGFWNDRQRGHQRESWAEAWGELWLLAFEALKESH